MEAFWTERRVWLLLPAGAVALIAFAWTLCRLATVGIMERMCVLVLTHLEAMMLVLVLVAFLMQPHPTGLLWLVAVAGTVTVFGLSVGELKRRDATDQGVVAYGVPLALFVYAYLHTLAYTVTFRRSALPMLTPFVLTPKAPLTPPGPEVPAPKAAAPAGSS